MGPMMGQKKGGSREHGRGCGADTGLISVPFIPKVTVRVFTSVTTARARRDYAGVPGARPRLRPARWCADFRSPIDQLRSILASLSEGMYRPR